MNKNPQALLGDFLFCEIKKMYYYVCMNYKYTEHSDPFGSPFNSQPPKKKKTKNRTAWVIISIVFVLVVSSVLYVFYFSQNEDREIKQTQKEVDSLLNGLSKISIIPNEEPVIFTISDADALIKEQQFFTNSQNGDTLLIFPKAMKAIIYSSSRGIVVNMGPVTSEKPIVSEGTSGIQEQQQVPVQEQIQAQESEEPTIE